MGCGVLFPRNYECKSDSDEELDQQAGVVRASDGLSDLSYISGVSGGGAGSGDSDRDDGFSPGSFDDYCNESNDEGRIAGVVVGVSLLLGSNAFFFKTASNIYCKPFRRFISRGTEK